MKRTGKKPPPAPVAPPARASLPPLPAAVAAFKLAEGWAQPAHQAPIANAPQQPADPPVPDVASYVPLEQLAPSAAPYAPPPPAPDVASYVQPEQLAPWFTTPPGPAPIVFDTTTAAGLEYADPEGDTPPDSTRPLPGQGAGRGRGPAIPGARTVAGAMFTPADADRRVRRTSTRAARDIEAEAKKALGELQMESVAAEKAERKLADYLPKNGESGPDALRSVRRLRVPPHRGTSQVVGGAYPFLAEAGLGSDGMFIGNDVWSGAGFVFDPWVLYNKGVVTNTNILLAGVIGRGKSTLAKALATRSIPFGRRIYVPGDPKGEWTVVAKAVGGQAIELGGGLATRLNPLDEGPRPSSIADDDWFAAVTMRRRALLGAVTESALGRAMTPTEHTALDVALDVAVSENSVPTLPMVVVALLEPTGLPSVASTEQLTEWGTNIGHALRRLVKGDLAGLFDGPSTARFDPSLPMVSLDLSRISGSDELIAQVMTCSSAWMEAALHDPNGGQRWVIYDEAWRLLKQPALLARMQSQWKLSRALGLANLMVIHRLSDLDAVGDANSESRALALGLLADCSTKIIYAQESGESAKTGATLGLSSTEQAELPDLNMGEGLWRIGQRAFVVRHLCTPGELELFDTNSRMAS